MHGKDAGQGLGELPVVDRDEVSPGRGHTLEATDRSGWEATEDLDDKIICEAGRRGPPSLGPLPLCHRPEQELLRKMKMERLSTRNSTCIKAMDEGRGLQQWMMMLICVPCVVARTS